MAEVKEGRHWLGAPRSDAHKRKFERTLLARLALADDPDSAAAERAVVYVDRIVDRQINKARGLLTFNALLSALLRFQTPPSTLTTIGSVFALFSCVVLLLLMYSKWAPSSVFATAKDDFLSACSITYERGSLINAALVLSIAATVIAAISMLTPLP